MPPGPLGGCGVVWGCHLGVLLTAVLREGRRRVGGGPGLHPEAPVVGAARAAPAPAEKKEATGKLRHGGWGIPCAPEPHYILTSGGGGPPTRCWCPRGHPGEGSGCQGTAGGDRGGGGGPGVGLAGWGRAGDCAPPHLSLAWGERESWDTAQEPP